MYLVNRNLKLLLNTSNFRQATTIAFICLLVALASIILGVVGIVGFIAWYLMARAEKQRLRDIQRARRG